MTTSALVVGLPLSVCPGCEAVAGYLCVRAASWLTAYAIDAFLACHQFPRLRHPSQARGVTAIFCFSC
eukprot:scaffold87760_cov54-Phaeocystis_antarctica.AAC.3